MYLDSLDFLHSKRCRQESGLVFRKIMLRGKSCHFRQRQTVFSCNF